MHKKKLMNYMLNYLTLKKTTEAGEFDKLRITLTLTALALVIVSLGDNSLLHYLSLLLGVLLIVFVIFK